MRTAEFCWKWCHLPTDFAGYWRISQKVSALLPKASLCAKMMFSGCAHFQYWIYPPPAFWSWTGSCHSTWPQIQCPTTTTSGQHNNQAEDKTNWNGQPLRVSSFRHQFNRKIIGRPLKSTQITWGSKLEFFECAFGPLSSRPFSPSFFRPWSLFHHFSPLPREREIKGGERLAREIKDIY